MRQELGVAWEQLLSGSDTGASGQSGFKRRRRQRDPIALEDEPEETTSGKRSKSESSAPSVFENTKTWEESEPRLSQHWVEHSGPVYSVAAVPNSCHIVTGSHDAKCKVWDAERGKSIMTLAEGHTDWVRAVVPTHDGRLLLSGSQDNTIVVWDLETGQLLRELTGHTNHVLSLAMLPNHRVLSASADKTIRIWDIGKGEELKSIRAHAFWVWSVATIPNGKMAISGSADYTAKLWNLGTGKMIHRFDEHEDSVVCVDIARNGRFAVTGSADKTLKIWNTKTGKLHGCISISVRLCGLVDGLWELIADVDETVFLDLFRPRSADPFEEVIPVAIEFDTA